MSPVIRRLSAYLSILGFLISLSLLTFVYYTPYVVWPIAAAIVVWVLFVRYLRSLRGMQGLPAGSAEGAWRGGNLMIIPVMIAIVVPIATIVLLNTSVG